MKTNDQDDELIQQEEINTQVLEVLHEKPKTQVLINADKSVNYGLVVTVMASLKNAGVSSVGLMTQPVNQ